MSGPGQRDRTDPGDHGHDDLAPLLMAAGRGDEAAWREVVARYGRRVFALAKSRCRDSNVAEDITQSVFATVSSKLGSGEYAEHGRFESWLFRVAMNRVRDHVRRVRRRPEVSDDGTLAKRSTERGEEGVEASMLDRLRAAMETLTEPDREVIELRHHGGLSFKQIAEMLDEPVGTLLARHHRALRKLRGVLEGEEAAVREALR